MATTTAVFRVSKDAGEPLDITLELTTSDLIRYTVPAGGPFVTGAPQSNTLVEGAEVLLSPLATIAANALTNPMTAANVLLFTEVSEGGADDANRQMLPLAVGVVVPHFATVVPDDGWLPVSGGTFNDVDYPELAGAIAAGNTVGTDLADGTFRLLDLNGALTDGRGRVFEGLGTQTPGELQNDATAPNGLRVNRTYVQSDWNGQQNTDVSKGSNSNPGRVIDGQVLSSSDTQTRAPAVSVLWMVRAKPWTHLGDVTINQVTLTPRTYTISEAFAGAFGNHNFHMGPFQVETSGTYQYKMDAQGTDTQGSRVSYNFEIRDAAGGAGNQIGASYLTVNTGAGASNALFNLPQAQGTVTLQAGTDYWVFGDRNTGGLNTGNRWTLELSGP